MEGRALASSSVLSAFSSPAWKSTRVELVWPCTHEGRPRCCESSATVRRINPVSGPPVVEASVRMSATLGVFPFRMGSPGRTACAITAAASTSACPSATAPAMV